MLSKRTRRLLSALLLGVSFFTGMYISRSRPVPETHQIVEQQQKVDYTETIMSQLESINKMEIYQAYLKNTVTIHKGFNNDFFRNDKTIIMYANGYYKLDLDNLVGNVIIGDKVVTIIAQLEYDVVVQEKKFEYSDNKGHLVFSDVKLTPEEQASMVTEVKQQMLTKMQDKEFLDIVQRKAEEIIEDQLEIENYKVRVIWK